MKPSCGCGSMGPLPVAKICTMEPRGAGLPDELSVLSSLRTAARPKPEPFRANIADADGATVR